MYIHFMSDFGFPHKRVSKLSISLQSIFTIFATILQKHLCCYEQLETAACQAVLGPKNQEIRKKILKNQEVIRNFFSIKRNDFIQNNK